MTAEKRAISPFWKTSVGFGLYLAWMMIGITPSVFTGPVAKALMYFNNSELIGRSVGLLFMIVLGFWAFRKGDTLRRKPWVVCSAILMCFGTLTVYLQVIAGIPSHPLLSFSLLSVAASSVFIALWGEQLCFLTSKEALQCISLAHIVGFLSVLLISLAPSALQGGLHIAAPALSGILLFTLSSQPSGMQKTADTPFFTPSLIKTLLGIGVFGIIMQFLFQFTEGKTANPNELLWLIAGLAVCAVFLISSLLLRKEIQVSSLSKWVLPLFVIAEFLIFAFDADQQPIEVFTIGCAWMFFRVFYFIAWRAAALASKLPNLCVLAVGQALLTCGCFFGGALYTLEPERFFSEFSILAGICVFAVLASLLFFDSRQPHEQPLANRHTFNAEDSALCEHCIDVATARYGLTSRERDIALYVIRDEDNAAIRDDLVVSTNTLRSHLRNLYKKTGVHSREELLLLLRSLMDEPTPR